MDSFNFEFCKQLAILTLRNDLKLTEGQIRDFEKGLDCALYEIGGRMVEISKLEKKRQAEKEQA